MTTTKRRFSFDPTLLIDLITIFCLSVGPVFLTLELIDQSQPLPVCCALAGAQVLFLLLLTRRWWILPALLGVCGAAFGITVWALEWETIQVYLVGMPAWLQEGLAAGTNYEVLRQPLYALLTLPLTAACWLLIRRLFHILPHALLGFGINFTLYLMESPDWQGVLLLTLGGLIVCLPRAAQGKKGDWETLPRKHVQLLALGLAILCLTGAFFIVPVRDGAWRVNAVRMLFSDVEDWYNNQFGTGAGGASGVVSELLPLGDRLGGDLTRGANLTLRVGSNYDVLLAGRYDDTYNGQQWYHGWQNGRFRWGSLLWRSRRSEAFQHKLPIGGRDALKLYDNMTRIVDVEIMAQSKDYTLYAPATPQYVKVVRQEDLYPYFNRVGELFTDRYYAPGTSYTLRSIQLCRDMKYFDNNMHSLMEITAQHSDPYEEEIRLRYTWLPEDLPASIGELTTEITQGARDAYDAMCRIERWLSENCVYNETPGTPPEGTDFVEHFLTTREGYCTYYASAMAVMARVYGLPSRYVTGYGLVREGDYRYVARELTSHAWAEVYFHGIGWVTFDPLNWDADDLADEEFAPQEYTGAAAPAPTPTPTPAPTPALTGEFAEIQADPNQRSSWILPLTLWLLGLTLTIFLLHTAVKFLFRRKDRQFAPERLMRKMGRGKAAHALYTDMETQLQLYNLSRADGETLRTWAQRVDRSLPQEEGTVRCTDIIAVYERMLYGGGTPFDEEIRALAEYHAAVEESLRKALGRSYLWRRAIR